MNVLIWGRSHFNDIHLWLARLGWLAIFLLVAGMYATNLPHIYQDTASEWQVGEALPAALRVFDTKDAFVRYIIALQLLTSAVFVGTGILLAGRKPSDWFVLFVSATLLLLSLLFGTHFDVSLIRYPAWLTLNFPAIRLLMPALLLIGMVLLFYWFPDGRFKPRWAGWLVIPATAVILISLSGIFANPWFDFVDIVFVDSALGEEWGFYIFVSSLLITLIAGLIAQILRYRRTTRPEQRQQTKWVLVGLSSVMLTPLFEWFVLDLLLDQRLGYSFRQFISLQLSILVPMLLPLTIAISILRYRLWDIDLLINRALVYGGLTALILGLYGLSIGLAGALIPVRPDWLFSLLALALALLIAAPLRQRLQRMVDRWLPRTRLEFLEDPPAHKPTLIWPWRLAHLAWIAIFIFIIWQAAIHLLTEFGLTNETFESTYLVQESLKLSWVSSEWFIPYVFILRMGFTVVFWLIAILIFLRKRDDKLALTISYMFIILPYGLVFNYTYTRLSDFLSMIGWFALALFPFYFPDGRFIPRSFRWRLILGVALLATPILVYPIARSIYPEYDNEGWGYFSLMVTLLVFMAAGLISQVYRYRHLATPTQRQQTKWVLFGLGLQFVWIFWFILGLSSVLTWFGITEPMFALVTLHLTLVGVAALPVAIGISILRYRLWDIDLLINRALVFGGLTLLIASAYVLMVGLFGALFQAGNSLALSILATGLIAILFHPLRQRLQRTINRLMYGERDDPATVLARLGERLAYTAVPEATLPTIVETIGQTLKLPYVAISESGGDGRSGEVLTEYGKPAPELTAFPLVYQGQAIGKLLAGQRAPAETFTPAEQRLLENIAQQAGSAVYAAQLTRHLQASRQQLITSREEERRRIRRDLHDGLGPQLATLSLRLDATRNYLAQDPAKADKELQELKGQVHEAIRDVRRLVYDLRPPALDQLGLVPALREFAAQNNGNGMYIVVEAPEELPCLPAAVEVAAYRIALEGMTNAARHAHASQCAVRLSAGNELYMEIQDNGVGMPDPAPSGIGISSMRERAAELGGTFNLQSAAGAGTSISICLPISTPEP